MKIVSIIRRIFRSTAQPSLHNPSTILNGFVPGVPTKQNMIDLIDGWNCAFPPEIGVEAGLLHLYADPRIEWALERSGGVQGKSILEIGPLEAGHSALLQKYKPANHIAVEANKKAYLKCLIAKELYPLPHVHFLLGDGVAFLENIDAAFDLIVASGVLYHLPDPIHFLKLASQRTQKIFLWTHYITDDFLADQHDPRAGAFSGPMELDQRFGFPIRFRRRRYHGAEKAAEFCGGLADEHIWLHRDDLLAVLRHFGFSRTEIAHEEIDRANGPACSIFAEHF